jgi:uncharacterized repeat protein (TIGR01451 family)
MKAKLTKTITAVFLFAFPVSGFGQIAPDLKSAADFAILAGTGISFAPPMNTINDMDVGLYPGVRSSITGDVANLTLNNGVILAADEDPSNRLPQAKLDLLNAYLFAAAATVPAPATISGNQGGLTLAPGIYKSTSTLSIEGTPLTLNAGGDENAVWIFQIESSLTTTAGGSVILTGGAKANNVYWQVGSSATIGSGTAFKGNILALVSISVDTGATIDGRLLARNGAVTFAGGGTMNKPEESQVEPGDLTITKTADPQTFSALNDQINYEIVVENIGTVTVTNITVEDDLTGDVWTDVTLGPGVSQTFTTSYNITAADLQKGFVANIATAEAEDIFVGAYEIVTKEGLLISKVANPKTYYAIGQVIDYVIVVENTGSTTWEDIAVSDDLTGDDWTITLGPGESQILETSYTIIESDMLHGSVDNTATATVSDTTVTDTETVLRVDPPPPVPLTTWAIVLGGILIAGFVFFQYRRSTPKSV